VTQKTGIDLCLCGEMATDQRYLFVLLGLGIEKFSLSAPYIPRLKDFLSKVDLNYAREVSAEILQMGSSRQIRKFLKKKLKTM